MLGTIRQVAKAVWMWAVAFACLAPASLAARPLSLGETACLGGASSAEAAFGLAPEILECGSSRNFPRERFVRAHIDIAKAGLLPPGRLIWQTDPTSFDSMLIRLTYVDGSERLIDVDAQMAVRNWDANGNFWVPIQQGIAALKMLDIVVERPQSAAVVDRMSIAGLEEADRENDRRRLLYTLICGLLIVPLVYDLFFYRVLRERFMIWNFAMTLGTLSYVLFNSGLVLLLFPDMDNLTRFAMIFVSTSLIMVGSARFSILVLEQGTLDRRWGAILTGSAIINLILALMLLLDIEALRMRLVAVVFATILPVIVAAAVVLTKAFRRNSRVARFLAVAYGGAMVAGLIQVAANLGIGGTDPTYIDEAIYLALVILVIGTSAGVGDRFLVIKAERDRARVNAKRLGAMANSDGLTGLLNRRAFDQHRRLGLGQVLLLADLDRFKQINDTFGHQRGDAVLCQAGRAIEEAVATRGSAQVYRLGGEEFAVLVHASSVQEVRDLCETIRAAVARPGGDGTGDLPPVTISIGACMGTGQLMHVAFSDADEALYRAKEAGRNRCELADS